MSEECTWLAHKAQCNASARWSIHGDILAHGQQPLPAAVVLIVRLSNGMSSALDYVPKSCQLLGRAGTKALHRGSPNVGHSLT